MNKKTLVLLVGETGAGKDTVANMLPYPKVVSYTTRPMREGEIDGINHYFVSDDDMDKLERSGGLIAWTKTGDIRYCATADHLEDDVTIYIINPDGVRWFNEHYVKDDLNVVVIGLFVPFDDRMNRCRFRGDNEEVLFNRIQAEQSDYEEFRLNCEFDYLIKNNDSEKTASIIQCIINKEIANNYRWLRV